MNKVKANISSINVAMQNENSNDEIVSKEVVELLKNKPTISVGCIYEMFGETYVAVEDKNDDKVCQCCDNCAFRDANCELNIDIPRCDNGVVFKKLSNVKLVIWDTIKDKAVAEIKQISNGLIETTEGQKYNVAKLLGVWIVKSIIE